MNEAKKERLIGAMSAAGYTYDELESTDDWLRFFVEYGGGVFSMDGWDALEDWLNGVVFDDPEVACKVQKILNMEVR